MKKVIKHTSAIQPHKETVARREGWGRPPHKGEGETAEKGHTREGVAIKLFPEPL